MANETNFHVQRWLGVCGSVAMGIIEGINPRMHGSGGSSWSVVA